MSLSPAVLFALELAVGFALADAAFAGDAFEGVFFGEVFGLPDRRDFVGDAAWLGWLCCGGVEGKEKDELSANGCARGELGAEFGDRAAEELLMELGELAGEDDGLLGAEGGFDVGEGVEDAVRGFVEDVG